MLSNLTSNNKIKKILYYSILFFIVFYLFSITAFDEIYGLHYINYASIILLFISIVIYEFIYLKRAFLSIYMLFPILFVLYAGIITLVNQTAISKIITISITLSSFIVVYQGVKIINNQNLLFFSLIFSAITYLIFFISMNFNDIVSLKFLDERIGGNIGNLNAVGENLLLYSSLFVFFVLDKKHWYFSFFSLPFIIFVYFTGSKMAFFGLGLLALFIIIILFRKKKLMLFLCLAILIIISIVMLQLPFFSTIKERLIDMILTILSGNKEASTGLRILYSEVGLYLGGQNLFFGLGADGFAYNTPFDTYSHNNFIEMLCNYGIIGFILFYIPFISIFLNVKKGLDNKIYVLALFMILFLFIMGFATVFYYSKTLPFFYAFAFGSLEEGAFRYKKQLVI